MKIIMFFLSVILMAFSCENVQLEDEITMIEFSSGGMSGYNERIQITSEKISITIEQRRSQEDAITYEEAITKDDWSQLINNIENINFSEIENLESPTMKRAYDGAMHSEIIVTTSKEKYLSPSFDDDNPHEKLKPLMNAIRALANRVDR